MGVGTVGTIIPLHPVNDSHRAATPSSPVQRSCLGKLIASLAGPLRMGLSLSNHMCIRPWRRAKSGCRFFFEPCCFPTEARSTHSRASWIEIPRFPARAPVQYTWMRSLPVALEGSSSASLAPVGMGSPSRRMVCHICHCHCHHFGSTRKLSLIIVIVFVIVIVIVLVIVLVLGKPANPTAGLVHLSLV